MMHEAYQGSGEVVVDEERLKKLSHLYSAKRRSVGEALTPIKVPEKEMKKSMSIEKIISMKGKSTSENGKKVQSLPRKWDFTAKDFLEEGTDIVEKIPKEVPPPLPEHGSGETVIRARHRSDTFGSEQEVKKAQLIGGHLSAKKLNLPAVNLSMLQKEGEDIGHFTSKLDTSKPLDLATTPSKKKLPPVKEDYPKDRGNYTAGTTTIPVIFRDMSLVNTGNPQIPPPSSPRIERALNKDGKKTTARGSLNLNKSAGKASKSKSMTIDKPPINTPRKTSTGSRNSRPLVSARKASVLSPTSMLKSGKEKHNLSSHEQKEVLEYSEIFYTGEPGAKIMTNSKTAPNKGYDDEKGDYKIILKDHVAYRYEIIGFLGSGAFGQVAKVHDHKSGKQYALKIIRNRKRYHDQALIEHKILSYIKQKDAQGQTNIINMVDFFYFRNHICFTFDLLSINLYDFIKANHFRGSSERLIRKFAVKLLQSMKFLAKHHIIHCDLKPENVLLNDVSKADITLIDFGSSCFEHEKIFTYIQSRFYRAPEIILGIPYGISIDMWSFGCILAELFTGYPLFPGENELDQLSCIMEIYGVPPEELLKDASRKKYFFASNGKPRIIENSQGIKRFPGTKQLQDFLPGGDQLFINFINDCLKWFPRDRLTPSSALQHPWLLLDGPIENMSNDLVD